MKDEIKVFVGSASKELGEKICQALRIPSGNATMTKFSDGELKVKVNENVRGRDTYVVQSTYPPGDNLIELLLFIDALRRASAERITAVIPYFGYARQDRKDEPRVAISAKLFANLITTAGADRVLTMELHAEQIQGFFDIPVDHLYAVPVFYDFLRRRSLKNFAIVSPDVGRVKRARGFANRLGRNLPIVIIDKRRTGPNRSAVVNVIGNIRGKTALLFDDILDTGGTIVDAARAVVAKGARRVMVCVTHPLFSGPARARLDAAPIEEVIVTDTVPLTGDRRSRKVKTLTVARLLADAIIRIHQSRSISVLFKETQ
jgi:ribose-phosphate pyrophosphokinase